VTRAAILIVLQLMTLLSVANPARAATFFSNGTGLANPATVITFDEPDPDLTPETIISQATNPFAAFGFAFFVAVYQPIPGIFQGGYVGNFLATPTLQIAQNFVIFFDQPQTRVAFKLFSSPHDTLFEAYLGQTLVENAIIATGLNSETYYGFDGILFDAIQITPNLDGSRAGVLLDNLQFGAVPEPSTWQILILGFGLAGAALRRQRPLTRPAALSTGH
jgi:hypothetical protein